MKTVGVLVKAEHSRGGAFQWWLSILDALSYLKSLNKCNVIVYSNSEQNWMEAAASRGLEYRHYNDYSNLVFAINKIFSIILPEKIWERICPFWFSQIPGIRKETDVVITECIKELGNRRIKCVVPIFDLMHKYEPYFSEVKNNNEEKRRDDEFSRNCRYAERILVDSEVGKNHVDDCYGHLIDKMSNRVRILPYIPSAYIYNRERDDLFTPPFEKYIFYPAQFWEHKNHIRLVEAIYTLKTEGIIVNLVLVGSRKNNYEKVLEKIEALELKNQVVILNYVENERVVSLYENARALIYPSFFGPTNIPPLEAMELGCPMAISDVYAMKERAGDAALYFAPFSTEQIASAIKELWCNDELCRSLIKKGKVKAKEYGQKEFAYRLWDALE